ncbi:MAG: cytochrome biosis protein [Steroidobacteraceae bacterium]|jgi:cytochrome c-type biogenesis protein CcmF|nr:cytochrome biosis protein [Steroidobacteraceae bacterium]
MIPEIGHFALILALLFAIAQAFFGLAGAARGQAAWMRASRSAVAGQSVFIAIAFGALAWSFIDKDFSVLYVATNSNSQLPIFYRIAAVWGAHEGSLLLWGLVLAGWSLAVTGLSTSLQPAFRSRVIGILGLISIGFLLFMLTTSNPFERLVPAAFEGRDLNPLLQDFALTIHPPILYAGYVGFSVAFAFACATLIEGRLDSAWARWTRPWTLAAWLFLSIGIALGSWWAYYELGWGGWWFWDPVENASFMPWLAGTALIHSLAVTEKRGLFKSWTILLAVSAFSLSLLGTFLVRSGVLVSVHAFATDPARGLFILVFLSIVIGGALLLYAWRAPGMKSAAGFELAARESFILFNNAFLVAALALILLGTLYPLFMDALELGKISVGPPYFNMVFMVPMLPLLLMLGIGMHTTWKRSRLQPLRNRLLGIAAVALVIALVAGAAVYGEIRPMATIGFVLALWVMGSSLMIPLARLRAGQALPGAVLGMAVAHFGVGVVTLGITGVQSFKIEQDVALAVGDAATIAGYDFRLTALRDVPGPNFVAVEADVLVSRDGETITTLHPQKRLYNSGGNPLTEAGIEVGAARDLFAALGEDLGGGRWSLRLQYKPLIRYIWLGALLIALGGGLAGLDRRYRRAAKAEPALDTASAEVT